MTGIVTESCKYAGFAANYASDSPDITENEFDSDYPVYFSFGNLNSNIDDYRFKVKRNRGKSRKKKCQDNVEMIGS